MKFPKVIQRAIAAETAKAMAAELARRTSAAPADTAGKGAKGPSRDELRVAMGLRIKSLWANHPMHASKSSASLRDWVKKSASAYESLFSQGGSLLAQEYSSEIIELLRPKTVLLRAGARKEVFTGKLNIGRLNGGATAEFVAEGKAPTINKIDTGAVILEGHKLMAIYEPSNDMLRNPSIDSAGMLSDDLLAAMALAADKAGFIGDGTGANPRGIVLQVKDSNKVPGVAITQANLNNVIRFIDTMEQKVKASNLELEGNSPFWTFSSAVESALKALRFENGGFIYRDQLESGKLNGKPVHITESLGDNYFFFGLASQLYFGLDNSTGDIILDMSQPHFAEDLTMVKAISKPDWKLRHNTAFAYSDNVALS
ncbi:MAG TPA: phage major capsid protein [Archangium sp.]|uniref:phage major capsid protein n=1 Tax=Archangium sp. TaxID=1872627 RepID=UPI002E32549B|nr:phage major capsid protein [Archangium sp.]HEX5750017.1 phage major capsid protein [Archangium sp.]